MCHDRAPVPTATSCQRNYSRINIQDRRLYIIFQMEEGINQLDSIVFITAIFQDEVTGHSQNLKIPVRTDLNTVEAQDIIDVFTRKNTPIEALGFKIFNVEINRYVPLLPSESLSNSLFQSPVIMIKYREVDSLQHLHSDLESGHSGTSSRASSESKRERNRERTVREVLQYVKEWRETHNTLDKHKNKINLQEAARMVGISKKSLDDYFCQLRLAEEYGFDFAGNMEEKVGVLRTFVKKHRPKGDLGLKHERLPKKLRIIEELPLIDPLLRKQEGEEFTLTQSGLMKEQKLQEGQVQTIMQAQYQPPMAVIPEDEYESRFYNSFNFMMDEPDDPFLMLGGRRNSGSDLEFKLF